MKDRGAGRPFANFLLGAEENSKCCLRFAVIASKLLIAKPTLQRSNEYMMSVKTLLDDPEFIEHVPFFFENYEAKDIILEEDDEGRDVFLILKGQVQVKTHVNEVGSPMTTGICKLVEEDMFGELSMFDGEPRSAQVVALSKCELVRFDGQKMVQYMDAHPEKGYFILREIFMRLIMHMRQSNVRTKTVLGWYLAENA